jgi:hypothetical protein
LFYEITDTPRGRNVAVLIAFPEHHMEDDLSWVVIRQGETREFRAANPCPTQYGQDGMVTCPFIRVKTIRLSEQPGELLIAQTCPNCEVTDRQWLHLPDRPIVLLNYQPEHPRFADYRTSYMQEPVSRAPAVLPSENGLEQVCS